MLDHFCQPTADRILVTGGTGFIGQHLLQALLERGCLPENIRVFVWDQEAASPLPNDSIESVRGNIQSYSDVFQAMKNVKIVFHLAARTDFAGKDLNAYFDTNVLGTQNILEAGEVLGLQRLIFYSSMAVHGIPAEVGPVLGWNEERAPQMPVFTNPYGHSKWIAEQRIRKARARYGLEYAIIRPTSVYGLGDVNGPTTALIRAIQQGIYFQIGSGYNLMEYVHVRDLVDGTLQAADARVPAGVAMMSGPQAVPYRSVVESIYRSLGKEMPRWWIPGWIGLLISYPLGLIRAITGSAVPLYPQRVKTLLSTYVFSTNRARALYGYAPKISLQDGVEQTVEWLLSESV
ncbi:NAD-dependent epimerase/dehydratase family protein [Candidatus Woesebacteria bacterium]|nr:NAD-dependent epimerase/dehydratase family protein [Candidatus Woesebacteria bacterium]MCD8506877.1 NAD-dependent epimerase/dehydratase family protein [Candidatus Woesebacteria bacterium]MCD8527503.1 NAD-dependent epimerase/dehydratase family protein [Candidatus Woesebacteria bacterium]MCD8546244.1 NAD-dependent epimerase/dehydratase family protein [Candidatus Woesebacteria bacterium]